MWEWFTTKPYVDAAQARFVRHLISSPAPLLVPPFVSTVLAFRTIKLRLLDRFSAYAMAVLADRRSSVAGTRADARLTRVPGGPLDLRRLVRRARQPRGAERRVYQGDVWVPRRGHRG
jgi:hypothetical protein